MFEICDISTKDSSIVVFSEYTVKEQDCSFENLPKQLLEIAQLQNLYFIAIPDEEGLYSDD